MWVLGLLPYLALALFFVSVRAQDGRQRFLYASVLWCFLVLCLTEALSLADAITPAHVRVAWAVICAVALLAAWRRGSWPGWPPLPVLGWVVAGLVLIPLGVGLFYPPLTWDALTYHLPRVEHWLQNGNVAYYPTPNPRQNLYAPFAEYVILQGRALAGDDLFANSVQWLAYAGSCLNASLIARLLGAGRGAQAFAALLCASIPMAILQASTCQTDMFAAWQISSMAALGLLWYRQQSAASGVLFGLALGLACLTKGTAYPIALPFVLVYAAYVLRHPRQRLGIAVCAALLALLCNIPFFARNTVEYGNPLASTQPLVKMTRLSPSVRNALGNIICNIGINVEISKNYRGADLHNTVTRTVGAILNSLGINEDNKKFFPWGKFSARRYFSTHEDTVQNLLAMLLMMTAFPYLFLRGKRPVKIYLACVTVAFILFCATIAWQPWITRLQLPLFVLGMPAVSLAFSRRKWLEICVSVLCILTALYYNLFNLCHPLLDWRQTGITLPRALEYTKAENYFYAVPRLNKEHVSRAVEGLCASERAGLLVGGDTPYYPLFRFLRERGCTPKIIHVTREADVQKVDSIFFLDVKCKFGLCRPEDQNPHVMRRDR